MVERAAATAVRARPLPSFRNPPVTEVVAGVYFDASIPDLRAAHLGLFWDRVRRDFPHTQNAGPVAPGNEFRWLDDVTGIPLSRLWLLSTDKTSIIQLQGDCFFFNWRKQQSGQEYPRYETIIANYERHRDMFLGFLKEFGFSEPKPMSCELTYVNHIPQGSGWNDVNDIASIFKDFCWSTDKELFPVPRSLSWSCSFDLPDNAGTLSARLSQVTRVGDPAPALRLDLVCKGIGGVKSIREARPWFDLAREWIVLGFADLTTLQAQKNLWQREDVV